MCDRREQFLQRRREADRLNRHSYPAYLLASLRTTSVWPLWQRLLTLARRWRLLSTVLRWIGIVLVWLETSAVFLLLFTVLAASALPLLGGAAVMLLIGSFQHRRFNAELNAALAGSRIYVCVASRSTSEESRFFRGMVRNLAAREDSAVIIVSPYFWKSAGLTSGHGYITLRRECSRVYLIRQHYFFSLRRHVLRPNGARVTIIY